MQEHTEKRAVADEAYHDKNKTIGLTERAPQDSRLRAFFIEELQDVYWAEQHIAETLPKMETAATAEELKTAFRNHLTETEKHLQRLEEVFGILGEAATAKKCEAMAGITKEGDEIIADTESGTSTRDVGLVMAAQKVEHYEIATYGGLAQLARTLGYPEVAGVLDLTLTEEKAADELLTHIAEHNVNYAAKGE